MARPVRIRTGSFPRGHGRGGKLFERSGLQAWNSFLVRVIAALTPNCRGQSAGAGIVTVACPVQLRPSPALLPPPWTHLSTWRLLLVRARVAGFQAQPLATAVVKAAAAAAAKLRRTPFLRVAQIPRRPRPSLRHPSTPLPHLLPLRRLRPRHFSPLLSPLLSFFRRLQSFSRKSRSPRS